MLLKRGIEIGSATWFNWMHEWAVWEVANDNIIVVLFVAVLASSSGDVED